jgi:hypothetical protein
VDERTTAWAFGGVLLTFLVAGIALARVRSRPALAAAALAPLAAFLAYEALVHRVMPYADIRIDWLLLLPIAALHGRRATARWRRLD